MEIAQLASIRDVGPLLMDDSGLGVLVELAGEIQWQGNAGTARSAASAASWLLCASDANAYG